MPDDARESVWLDRELDFPDDPLLRTAYTVSEWAITHIGPIFWMCLAYLFLVAQFGS